MPEIQALSQPFATNRHVEYFNFKIKHSAQPDDQSIKQIPNKMVLHQYETSAINTTKTL